MYILTEGKCKLEVKTREPSGELNIFQETKHIGSFFGMLAMFYACPYSATVTALTNIQTYSISHDELVSICKQDDEGEAIMANISRAMKKHLLRELEHRGIPEFKLLDDAML